jgi:DNA-directed RNA polymerase subunit alpha
MKNGDGLMIYDINKEIDSIINEEINIAKRNITSRVKAMIIGEGITNEILNIESISIEDTNLPIRTRNALKRAGILTLRELALCSKEDLKRVRNLGSKSREELYAYLKDEHNITLRDGFKIEIV